MISDVLCEALAEIERYQTDPVFAHEEPMIVAQLDAVKSAMRGLLRLLDTPPPCPVVEEKRPTIATTKGSPEGPCLGSWSSALEQTFSDIDGIAGEARAYVEDQLATIPTKRRQDTWSALADALDEAKMAVLLSRDVLEVLQDLEDHDGEAMS